MRRAIGFLSVVAALSLGLALAACGGTPTGLNPEIRLSFEGSVTSVVDGAPMQGATVKFVKYFLNGPRTRETTITDAAGRYALTTRYRCAPSTATSNVYLEAFAPRPPYDSATARPVCTTATQTIDFRLHGSGL